MTNKRFEGVLLVCDMDGTLLDSRRQVSRQNMEAIEQFVHEGGKFTVATGRTERSVQQFPYNLPINAPVIVYNGALIYDLSSDKPLWSSCLSKEAYGLVKEIYEEFNGIGIEVFHGGDAYFLQENEETDKHLERERLTVHRTAIYEVPQPWYKVILAWEPSLLPQVEKFLKDKMEFTRNVYSEPQFLELLNKNTSKGCALEQLASLMDQGDFKTIAVGDNLNDMELIETANVGIAVENAHQQLKSAANLCCCHHDKHAVAQVIEWIFEGRFDL